MEPFTLVSTVFNERKRLDQTLADLAAQTLQPAEMIVVDAGSTDGTVQLLEAFAARVSYPVRVLVRPKANIAEGRNLAIAEAQYPLIASTDFGCRFAPRWLESLIGPFSADPSLEVVGGAFTILRDEVKTPAARADYILAAGYPPDTGGLFSVSSRSIAYRKHVWQAIGGYQEWLTLAADDTIFWRQIKHGGYRFQLVSEANVYWLRHQSYTGFGKENYRYGLGDGESGINKRNFFSHALETFCRYFGLVSLVAVLAIFLIFGLKDLLVWLALPSPFLAFGLRSYRHARKNFRLLKAEGYTRQDLRNAFYLIEVTRLYYMRGYVQGWLFAPKRVREGRAKFKALPA